MARGTGTRRALSEANISELIRGNPAALAAQAAKGGNVQPAQPGVGLPPRPTPEQAAANAAASAAGVQASNNPNAPQPTAPQSVEGDDAAADVDSPAEATPSEGEKKSDKKDKEEEKKEIQYRDKGGSGPQFLFGMGGKGDINEGADAGVAAEQKKALLKKLVKKFNATPGPGQGPTPPPAGPSR